MFYSKVHIRPPAGSNEMVPNEEKAADLLLLGKAGASCALTLSVHLSCYTTLTSSLRFSIQADWDLPPKAGVLAIAENFIYRRRFSAGAERFNR